jgi:hypothetical protein
MLLLSLNRNEAAIQHFSAAVRLDPKFGQAAKNLQFALSRQQAGTGK